MLTKQELKEINIKLNKNLEQCLDYLETISGKSKGFIIKEALIQYVEDMQDIQKISILEELGEYKKQKTYTSEELSKKLGI